MANENLGVLMGHKTADGQQPVSEAYPLPVVASPGTATPTSLISKISRFIGWSMFHATPTTRTEGQAGPLQSDALGNLLASLATKLAGEDIDVDVTTTEFRGTYYYISSAGTYNVKSSKSLLHRIFVAGTTTGTVSIYDDVLGTANLITVLPIGTATGSYEFNCECPNGIKVVTTAADKITIIPRK